MEEWKFDIQKQSRQATSGGRDEDFSYHNFHLLGTFFVVRELFERRTGSAPGTEDHDQKAHHNASPGKGQNFNNR